MSEIIHLALKYNNLASNDACPICGGRTDPAVGPEVFLDATWSPVCDPCAYKHAPDLAALRDAWQVIEHALFELRQPMVSCWRQPAPPSLD